MKAKSPAKGAKKSPAKEMMIGDYSLPARMPAAKTKKK